MMTPDKRACSATARRRPGLAGGAHCVVAALGVVVGALGPFAAASLGQQKSAVRLAITPLVARPRSHAPQVLELVIRNDLLQLLQGTIEMEIYAGKRAAHRFRIPEVVVPTGEYRLRVTMPQTPLSDPQTPVTGYVQLITPRGTYNLGEHDLVVQANWRRVFCIGVVQAEEFRASREQLALQQALSVDRFNPPLTRREEFVVYPNRIPPKALPNLPSMLCGFDVLLLFGHGLSDLRAEQLAAIERWVAAGGAVCARPPEQLNERQVEFLNRLTGAADAGPRYWLDNQRKLHGPLDQPDAAFKVYRYGAGRVLIVHRAPVEMLDADPTEWQQAVLNLWGVRASQRDNIGSRGAWVSPTDMKRSYQFEPRSAALQNDLVNLIRPAQVRRLPFSLVVVLLFMFALVIGPGDYLLLGLARARRFTWPLLFAVSLLFTYVMARLAVDWLGRNDYRTALVICDLADDGAVARESRFELHFVATPRSTSTPLPDTLVAMLNDRPLMQGRNRLEGDEMVEPTLDGEAQPGGVNPLPVLVGHGATTVFEQSLRQWSPVVARYTRFSSEMPVPQIPWQSLDPADWQTAEGRHQLRTSILAVEPLAQVYLFNALAHAQARRTMLEQIVPASATSGQALPIAATADWLDQPDPSPLVELLRSVSFPAPRGVHRVLARLAPNGAANLEDLALIDPGDPGPWLLVVVIPRGDDVYVYRKLYDPVP